MLQAKGREGGLGHVVEVTGAEAGELEVAGGTSRTRCGYDQSSGMGGDSRAGCNSGGCNNASSSTGGGSSFGGDINRAECNNEGGNGTRAGVVEELEEAGDSWEATLLVILLQLCQLLAVHTGGADGT